MFFLKSSLVLTVSLLPFLSQTTVLASELPDLSRENDNHQEGSHTGTVVFSQPINDFVGTISRQDLPLSPGDRIRIQIPGVGGEEFSGDHEVSFNGTIDIPFLGSMVVAGLSPTLVQEKISSVLLEERFFQPDKLKMGVQVLGYSPVQITVLGAVFQPGRLLLSRDNSAFAETNALSTEIPGDYPLERYLTSALKSTGGIKPNADISKIQILRGGVLTEVDLSGVFSGERVADYPLVAGDEIIVPSSGVFQDAFVKPSQITPDSIDLYVSNLTEPNQGGALQGNRDINVASFKYGSNLLQVLVASGCVGGTRSTNAGRQAALIHTDVLTQTVNVSEYRVQALVNDKARSIEENPLLMPNDAIACYDSRNTNLRSIFDTVTDFLNPLNILQNILN